MKIRNWTARVTTLALIVIAGSLTGAGAATAATVCNPGGDVCVVTGGFAGLQADIAASGASAPIVNLLTAEAGFSQRLHPPNPCLELMHPPGPCHYLPSELMLVLVDYQAATLAGLLPGCPGGCGLSESVARVIDADIRTMFADPTLFPPGAPNLPVLPQASPS